ncbi:MAG: class I SAM-dependent methyltransferase [Spirochaetes bacterium]|nr:class I SAM-dependent methyltransferase [Spirochaetota bacterium]
MTVYDSIGDNYNETRRADERILSSVLSLLKCPPGSLVADIGAGTGNYSYELARLHYTVHALEPSDRMRRQRRDHENLAWFSGSAERMPLDGNCYDGVVCILATHHFSSLEKAYGEMHRILRRSGTLVVFTADPRMAEEGCWIRDYFHPHYESACGSLPERGSVVALVEDLFASPVSITPFLLPGDLADSFFYSAWRYPERYLDAGFRSGISCFALSDDGVTENCVGRLGSDLKNGRWDERYGHYRNRELYDGGYCFLSVAKQM